MKSSMRSVTQLVSRRCRCLWVLVVLVAVGFFLHNVAVRRESSDRFNVDQEKMLSFLQKVWVGPPAPLDPPLLVDAQGAAPRTTTLDPGPGSEDKSWSLGDLKPPTTPPQTSTTQLPQSCRPKSHLVFLKTHKTGSSTVQNILYRYGEGRSLSFALPRNKFHRFYYPMLFQSQFVEGVESRNMSGFHILCNHMRFNKSEVSKVMPENSFYFSILRDPVPMMESMFNYFSKLSASLDSTSLDQFLDDKLQNFKKTWRKKDFTHNNLVFDFGYENNVTADTPDLEDRAARIIAGIERDFDLVLINDYFDESMILLKHALCWSLEDVVSFRLNSRSEDTRQEVPTETAQKIKRWNALDWRIYQHFNQTFWARAEREVGLEELSKEVGQLRDLQTELQETCLKGGGAVDPSEVEDAMLKPFQGGVSVILGYNLNPDLDEGTKTTCERLITPELTYTHFLYNQQFPEEEEAQEGVQTQT